MRARALLSAALAVILVATSPLPVRAERVQAEAAASLEKGFGRLVLTFKNRNLVPQYTLRQNSGVVVIEFTDEVDVDIDQIPTTLGPYVTVARRDPEGRSLRIALSRQVRLNTMEAGEKLFLDFLPAKWAGAPPPLPPEVVEALAKRAEAAMRAAREAEMAKSGSRITPKLDFKIGRLPTFTRFSFGWNVPFDTRMTREGERVTLTFNKTAKIDFSPIDLQPVPGLVDVYADPTDETMKIVFTVTADADVRGFRERDAYVLDLVYSTKPSNPGEALVQSVLTPTTPGTDRVIAPGRAVAPSPDAAASAPPPAPPSRSSRSSRTTGASPN